MNINELDLFELCYELIEINSCESVGYKNVYDISVNNDNTFLLENGIVSHNSARSGLLPSIGRNGIAYYELKGKPLNAITATQSKFTQNSELSMLYKIIKQEGFKKIVIAADADLDGYSITGLLLAFLYKYLPEILVESTYMLRTPIAASIKNKQIVEWTYSFDDIDKLKGDTKYFKGYGSWKSEDLKVVIAKDGFDKMVQKFDYTPSDNESIQAWYNSDNSDKRKGMIKNNEFDLIKL